jgi:ectoine hydroxylase-related dioxygenase (phytanoyl-CoA dioxygenase family)
VHTVIEQIRRDGFAVVPAVFDLQTIESLIETLAPAAAIATTGRGGTRSLLSRFAGVRELSQAALIQEIVQAVIGPRVVAIRAILFDKTPAANWKVPWHQDLTIAVESRVELAGFGPWTIKEGAHHVQPPVDILENMLAVRVHLDDCSEDNGPVRVIAGSHRNGRMNSEQIQAVQESNSHISCTIDRGGLLVMRPLLLHASSAAASPGHRRVIHIEYAAAGVLPEPLRWHSV